MTQSPPPRHRFRRAGLALLLAAWPALVPAQQAAPQAEAEPALARPVEIAARRALWLRYFWGEPGERFIRRTAAELQQLVNDFTDADRHWRRLGHLYREAGAVEAYLATLHARTEIAFFQGDYERAYALKQRELSLATREDVPQAVARAESGLGVILRRRGRLDEAMVHFQHALDLRRALGDRYGEADTLVQLASAHRNKGDYSRALDMLLESLRIRESIGEWSRLDLSWRALAVLYREVEDFPKAQQALEQALHHAERLGDPLALSPVLGILAALHNDLGESNLARTMARRALEIDGRLGNRSGIAQASLEIGRAALELGDLGEAESSLGRALTLADGMRQGALAARARLHLALLAEERGRLDEAAGLLDAAAAAFRGEDARPLLLQALAARESIHRTRREWEPAAELAQQRAVLREELLGVQSSRRLAGVLADFDQQRQRQQIALLTKDNEIQALQLQRERLRRGLGIAVLTGLAGWLAVLLHRYRSSQRLNRALAARNEEIAAQRAQLEQQNLRLERQAKALYHAAISDPLTGIFNRGHLLETLRRSLERAQRDGSELAVFMTDFDHFKAINDRHGHLFGDRVLAAGVERVRLSLRPADAIGRYGGEELLVVLPNTGRETAVAVAERVRRTIEGTLAQIDGIPVGLTVSIGVASLADSPLATPEALIDAADQALYAAKQAGRNRVRVFGEAPRPEPQRERAHG